MKIGFFRWLTLSLALLGASGAANAVIISDGSLSINVTSNGRFNVITLNGTAIDQSSFVQQQFVSGGSFTGGSAVGVVGPTATYSASSGSLAISATSVILGPLGGNPNSSVFQQSFTFTNNGSIPIPLSSVSYSDPDVGNTTANLTQFDPISNSVYATAPAFPGRLFASTADSNDGAFAFHNAVLGTLGFPGTFANLNNVVGPIGVNDIEHAVGLDFGILGVGQSTTMDFQYLFATNLQSPPGNFGFDQAQIPEPASLALLGIGLAGLGFARKKKAH